MDQLTSEQVALLHDVRDEWLRIGLSTEPADRAVAEAGLAQAYRAAGLEPPRSVVWLESPWAGAIAAVTAPAQIGPPVMAQVADQVRNHVRVQVRDQIGPEVRAHVRIQVGANLRIHLATLVGDQVWAEIGDQVWQQVKPQVRALVSAHVEYPGRLQARQRVEHEVRGLVRDQLRSYVGPHVWTQVGDQFMARVGPQVWDHLRDQLGDQVNALIWEQSGPSVGDQVEDRTPALAEAWSRFQVSALEPHAVAQLRAEVVAQALSGCYGHQDAAWLSFYDCFARLGGIDGPQRLAGLMTMARSTGWWWAFRDVAILTERPLALHRDDRGRFHCSDGMALEYPGGWGIYAWHGVRVPAQVILSPRSLTVEQIRDEPNVELRRIMLERFGQNRYLSESGARLVHKDDWGELYRAEMPSDEPLQMVKVVNSTPEPSGERAVYWLRVPPQMRTAKEAVAWTFNKSPEGYRPAVES